MEIALVLLAGGLSTRMGPGFSKVFYEHLDKPIALYSLEIFQQIDQIHHTTVVCDESRRNFFPGDVSFAHPGNERFLSLENALNVLPASVKYVLVHDAARPVILEKDIRRLIDEGLKSRGATLGSKMRGTIARVDQSDQIDRMEKREELWETHTPQMAQVSDLLKAIHLCKESETLPTDEMSLLSTLDIRPKIIESSFPNIKITFPSDLPIVCKLLDHLHGSLV